MIHVEIQKNLHGSKGDMDLDITLDIQKGEFVVLMGESGSGKTTVLRVLAGLEQAEGDIVVEGLSWQNVSPQQREIGFVFQDYALFEHMTVEENLLFVNDDKPLVSTLLEMTELTALNKRNVRALSGGQKQRVSLCRAMMKKPKLLLMDEPLSALDPQMRTKLQYEIKLLHENFGTTTIMVSHEPTEVYTLADRVLVLEQGKVIQDGLVDEVLACKNSGHQVEILKLRELSGKRLGTVFFGGKFIEIEVEDNIKISDKINIELSAKSGT